MLLQTNLSKAFPNTFNHPLHLRLCQDYLLRYGLKHILPISTGLEGQRMNRNGFSRSRFNKFCEELPTTTMNCLRIILILISVILLILNILHRRARLSLTFWNRRKTGCTKKGRMRKSKCIVTSLPSSKRSETLLSDGGWLLQGCRTKPWAILLIRNGLRAAIIHALIFTA